MSVPARSQNSAECVSLRSSPPSVYLVEERLNPTSDFFVLPLARASGQPVHRCTFDQTPDPLALQGATVVFVRYVPPRWARLVTATRTRLARLVFFMDDDLLDLSAARGMPWRYRLKLARLATWRRRWLRDQDAELWVSTPYLQQKYPDWHPRLISPVAPPARAPESIIRVFYHGSASHAAEIRWLYPVLEAALQAEPSLAFEIIGDLKVNRCYRRLPRTSVIHPMSWPSYQSFVDMPGRHIGLAPLLDRPFNRARSCTKFFDITRAGAVGLYSPGPICADLVAHGVTGWVVPLHADAWVEAILRLGRDAGLRQRLLQGARERMAHSQGRLTAGMWLNEKSGR